MHIPITGLGIISGLGRGLRATLDGILSEHTAVGRMRFLQSVHSDIPVAEVPFSNSELSAMCSAGGIHLRTALMGRVALEDALKDAGLREDVDIAGGNNKLMALVFGTTVGGMDLYEKACPEYISEGVSDSGLSSLDCGSCTEQLLCGMSGFDVVTTISTACSSALNAIITGARMIMSGRVDIAVCGGGECLSKYHLNGFNSLMILDDRPCRPFDETRAGLNLGEGAGFLVLESEESARKRGIQPVAYMEGYGCACDAFHQTASSPEGEGAFLAMRQALESAGLKPSQIDYINAHGTGTPNNDPSEANAVRRLFGDLIPPISSTKGFTGHTTSASGSIESVISILAMKEGFIPTNLNFSRQMEGCGFIPSSGNVAKSLNHVLVNAFGFGGNDSSVVFGNKEVAG